MKFERKNTIEDREIYENMDFKTTDSEIRNPDGSIVFSAKNIEIPEAWSQVAADVLAQKYFRKAGVPKILKKVYEEDKENLHPYTINRIENGLNLNASDYVDAIENAKKMKFDLSTIFEKFDAIITPAAPGEAPRDLSTTGNAMFNGYWTMMGVPAISLPLLTGENSLPIGVQVITSWQNDNLLLKISDEILKDYQ